MTEFSRLVDIMRQLREECPWDREQTHETLKPYLIEEAYELLDAIDEGNDHEMTLELGDVLLQVVFHAQIASEGGRFSIEDVSKAISDKLVRRHPHIFGDVTAEDADTVARNWDAIKRQEKEDIGEEQAGLLDDVPRSLPALMRAQTIQKKAARVGFDWDKVEEVTAKAREEVSEFAEAVEAGKTAQMEEELGDLLFSIVNVARYIDVSPEQALTRTNQKFLSRFAYIEQKLTERGSTPAEATLEEMDALWEEAKGNTPTG